MVVGIYSLAYIDNTEQTCPELTKFLPFANNMALTVVVDQKYIDVVDTPTRPSILSHITLPWDM